MLITSTADNARLGSAREGSGVVVHVIFALSVANCKDTRIVVEGEVSPISNGQRTVATANCEQNNSHKWSTKTYVGQRLDFCLIKFDMGLSDMGCQLE